MQQNKRLITISMLSAIAFVLTFIKFPIPFLPPYLTLDFSDVPSLLATFTFGPVAGIVVALVKNLLNYLFSMGDPVGPFANFLAGASFLLTAYAIYKNKRSDYWINHCNNRYDYRVEYFELFRSITFVRYDI